MRIWLHKIFYPLRYNQNINHGNIAWVYYWNDVYEKIAEIKRK